MLEVGWNIRTQWTESSLPACSRDMKPHPLTASLQVHSVFFLHKAAFQQGRLTRVTAQSPYDTDQLFHSAADLL